MRYKRKICKKERITYTANDVDFKNVRLQIDLMDDGKVIESRPRLIKGWNPARRYGARMLKNCEMETAYCRIYDPEDPTDIDFITRERMFTRKYVPDMAEVAEMEDEE